MPLDRRKLLAGAAGGFAAGAPITAYGLDAAEFGVRPDSPDDQSLTLQRALDRAAQTNAPLALMPGTYRVGDVRLPSRANLVGVRGATRLVLSRGTALLASTGADHVTLSGLVLDGAHRPLPDQSGLVRLDNVRALQMTDCTIGATGGHGLYLLAVDGEIAGNTLADIGDFAILSYNARGLTIARNTIRQAGNCGVAVLRWETGDDGTMVLDNRIERVTAKNGGSGQFGNGINAYRAANVIVRGNRIRDCAFSAVRGNSADAIQITGNSVSDVGEVALYSEFAFEGAVISGNTVEKAALGVSVCNFNEGGRLAVVSGNLIRRLAPKRPPSTSPEDAAGVGIYVEADSAVTGNVVEEAPQAAVMLGWGSYLRDVAVTGNVLRRSDIGVAVSVVGGAGSALIADNVISGAVRGAIVGTDHNRPVTGDLLKSGLARYAHIAASGNRAS